MTEDLCNLPGSPWKGLGFPTFSQANREIEYHIMRAGHGGRGPGWGHSVVSSGESSRKRVMEKREPRRHFYQEQERGDLRLQETDSLGVRKGQTSWKTKRLR